MLELRPCCECCGVPLPPDSGDAWICSFECTFCGGCKSGVLGEKCPNCGGDLQRRPTRAAHLLLKYPASTTVVMKSGASAGTTA